MILDALPSNLIERLYGHLRAQYLESELHNDPLPPGAEGGVIAGELAELLVSAELRLFPYKRGEEETFGRPDPVDDRVSQHLLGILHDPAVINLDVPFGRNPDIVLIDTEDGTVQAIGEVKIGPKLDRRAFKQLKPDGFVENIRRILDYLNNNSDLGKKVFGNDENGLPIHGQVAKDFFQVVFLPSDTDITEKNWDNLIKKEGSRRRKLTEEEVATFKLMLGEGWVRLENFSFSRDEIGEIGDKLMKHIQPMIEKDSLRGKEPPKGHGVVRGQSPRSLGLR